MLVREKEQHGPSMVQGRDGGSDCIKSQLSVAKLIRPPNVDEVVQVHQQLQRPFQKAGPFDEII
jgi:hypothetical protein